MSLEIKLFNNEMWEEMKEFIKSTYSSDYWMLDNEYFDWWFRDSPSNWDNNYRIIVGILNNKIISFVGQVANTFLVKGREYRGAWYTNGMIHPDYRGRGLGTKIYDAAKQFTKFAAAVSFNEPAGHIFQKIGFNTFNWRRMKRAIYLTNPSLVRQLPCFDNNLLEKILNHFSNIQSDNVITSPLTEVPDKDQINKLWLLSKDRYSLTTKRSYEFLKWRYQDHPRGKYLFFPNYNDTELNAMVVCRVETSDDFKVLRIADVFGEKEGIKSVLTDLITWAEKQNICLIDFFCTNWPDYEA